MKGTAGLKAACFIVRTISRGKLQAFLFFFFPFLMVMLISGAALAADQPQAGLAPEMQCLLR